MHTPPLVRRLAVALAIVPVVLGADVARAQTPAEPVAAGAEVTAAQPALLRQSGEIRVAVRLKTAPLIVAAGPNARRLGARLSPAAQRAYAAQLRTEQDAVMAQVAGLGGRELGRVSKASNALVVAIDAARMSELRGIAGVSGVRELADYQLALSTTVGHIGAAVLHAGNVDGSGVKVAVIDSGIDYTHRNLGGAGTAGAYAAAYGTSNADPLNTTRDGLFPTAKVVDGYDFVGEVWPNGPRTQDPDPIDFEGHGTHVGDIIAGRSLDGLHKGVAPGATLMAIKACSAVSSSCNGLAMLLSLDFAVDPNGDDDISDAADVINLSLGSGYGQREDDMTHACNNVVAAGIVVVAAAGNDGDKPFVASSPSVGPGVISVAQTQVATAFGIPLIITAPASIAGTYSNTATLSFAPVDTSVSGDVVYLGRGCIGDTYLADPAGKIALIDRGACNISEKIDRAANAGAIGTLIGLVAAGDAVTFSLGNGTLFVPSLVITQANATMIKSTLAGASVVTATLSPANAISLANSIVASSARGPGYSYGTIKPDIAAPGASISAVAGSGDGQVAFGGTSGATPVVAGAAALLIQSAPTRTPAEIKALLMGTASTTVLQNPLTQPGVLAPVTRIGGGEVRIDRAVAARTAAWDAGDPASTSLSFYVHRLSSTTSFTKKVAVRNYLSTPRTYALSSAFRYANDAASGAVTVTMPASLNVAANATGTFTMKITVNASLLPPWNLNGGSQGGNGALLQGVEFDGYVTMTDASDTITLPWHVLPHKAANVIPAATTLSLNGATTGILNFSNTGGATTGPVDTFSLTGTSPQYPFAVLPKPGENYAVIDLKSVGVRAVNVGGGTIGVQFAITTWGERAHPNYPAEFDIYVDSNADGTNDYVIYNAENTGFAASGQSLVVVQNLATSAQVARFYNSADLSSANVVFTVLASDIGVSLTTPFKFGVLAFDNYFTGAGTDMIDYMTYTLGAPRFTAPSFAMPVNVTSGLSISSVAGGDVASPSQTGLLFLYTNGKKGRESDAVIIQP